jgi:hypothetical protein
MIDLQPTDAGRAALPVSSARPAGPRRTAQRAEVQRALAHTDGFVSAQALHAAICGQASLRVQACGDDAGTCPAA